MSLLSLLRKLFAPARRKPAPPPARPERPRTVHTRPSLAPQPQTTPPDPIQAPSLRKLQGRCYVIDGDTIVINGTHIRLAGIDAPEMDQPWGRKAKFAMVTLCKGHVITAELDESTSYDRLVAKCYLPDGTDLSAEMVKQGLALDWAKFSGGAYRHLEPEGVRKKLWRVSAKHQGRLKMEKTS